MISSRAKYVVRALLDLSMRSDEGPILIQHIATAQNIPIRFLEQILLQLNADGIVISRTGPGGGYQLAASPDKITLGAEIRAIEVPLAPISCVSVTKHEECGCPDPGVCGLQQAWKEARDALAGVLDRTSYAHIQKLHAAGRNRKTSILDYVI